MKSRTKKTLSIGVFLVGLTTFGGYLINQNQSQDNLKSSNNIPDTRERLMARINRMNSDIRELRKNSASNYPDDTEKKLRKLSQEMMTLRNQFSTLSDNVVLHAPESELDAETPELALTEEEREAEVKAQIEQQLNLYDNIAIQEGVDLEWASKAQADVYKSFHNLSADGVGISEVKCHSSFCQARFSIDSDSNTAFEKLQGVSPWEGESFIWIQDIEQGEGVIYLAREGQPLPDTPDTM